MKVDIGPFRNWVDPYQIADMILYPAKFFMEENKWDDITFAFGNNLSKNKDGDPSTLQRLCEWIHSKKQRRVKVRIDKYDTWNADDTLSHIILPLLREFKDRAHGCMTVDDEDVPDDIKSTNDTEPKKNEWDVDSNWEKRSEWLLTELIWTFEQLTTDWEMQYYGPGADYTSTGPRQLHQNRISNGLRLFGKYYQGLWS